MPLDVTKADGTSLVQSHLELTRPEEAKKTHIRPSTTHLISFRSCSQDPKKPCNAFFFEQLRNLSAAASQVPIIRHHHLYQGLPRELLESKRWAKHVVEGVRGRGYWFWKPALVNLLLKKGTLQLEDTVIWADADYSRAFEDPRISELWPVFLANNSWDIFAQSQKFCEASWTKGDIFKHFGVHWSDPHYGLTTQMKAQFWIMKLNHRTIRFMKHWEDLISNFTLVSDMRSETQNAPLFAQNRHDQSLFSMLLKASLVHMDSDPRDCKAYADLPEVRKSDTALRRAAGEGQALHPRYGIRHLKATLGDFKSQAKAALRALDWAGKAAQRSKAAESRHAAKVRFAEAEEAPAREICVRGVCRDLAALPPGALPSGVE